MNYFLILEHAIGYLSLIAVTLVEAILVVMLLAFLLSLARFLADELW